MSQLLKADDISFLDSYHIFEISPAGRAGEAGRWCNENIKGYWTFRTFFGQVHFYIKEDRDAMLFKLTWHQ